MYLTYSSALKLTGDLSQVIRSTDRARARGALSFKVPVAAASTASFSGWSSIDLHDVLMVIMEARLPEALTVQEKQPLLRGGPSAGVGNGDPITFSPGVAVAASGSITPVAKANLLNDETFILDDGVNAAQTFYFQVTGAATGPGTIVDVQADTTADEVRDRIISAITGAALLDISASIGGDAATGTLTSTTKASLLNDETFILDDGVNAATTFYFQVTGAATGPGTAVDVQADTTADEVRDRIISAVNGVAGTLAITATIGGAAATGTITSVAKSLIIEDETFVLDDGVNVAVTFFFDLGTSAQVETAVLRKVDLSPAALQSAGEVAEAMAIAINAAPALAITALLNGTTVELTNDAKGTTGNVAMSETVANAGFTVSGMTGGTSIVALTNDASGSDGNVAIVETVADASFVAAGMTGGTSEVALVNDTAGTAGNVTITETVADAGFIVSGMSGGLAAATIGFTFRDRDFYQRSQIAALLNSPYILSGGDNAATPTTHPPERLMRAVTFSNPNAFPVDVHIRVLTHSHVDQSLLP